jgi:hypothetical protein
MAFSATLSRWPLRCWRWPSGPHPVLRAARHAGRRAPCRRSGGDEQRRPPAVRELLGLLRRLRPPRPAARGPRRGRARHRDHQRRLQPTDARSARRHRRARAAAPERRPGRDRHHHRRCGHREEGPPPRTLAQGLRRGPGRGVGDAARVRDPHRGGPTVHPRPPGCAGDQNGGAVGRAGGSWPSTDRPTRRRRGAPGRARAATGARTAAALRPCASRLHGRRPRRRLGQRVGAGPRRRSPGRDAQPGGESWILR